MFVGCSRFFCLFVRFLVVRVFVVVVCFVCLLSFISRFSFFHYDV